MFEKVCTYYWRLHIGDRENPLEGATEANVNGEAFSSIGWDRASICSKELSRFNRVELFSRRGRNHGNVRTGVDEEGLGRFLVVNVDATYVRGAVQIKAGFFRDR